MKILVTIGAGLLLTTTALAQVNEEVVDGKKLDKENDPCKIRISDGN